MCYYSQTGKTAGEEISSTYEGRHLTVVESELTHPSHTDGFVDKGDPVLHGENIVGIAFKDAAAATDLIAIDTEGLWFLTVYGTNEDGNVAVAYGDEIFINKTTCVLSKNNNKYTHQRFGIALDAVVSGSNEVIAVKVHGQDDDEWERIGSSGTPKPMNTADMRLYQRYCSTAATSGTTYIDYARLDVSGAGVEGIAGRRKTLLTAAGVGNAHGGHDTLELDTSAGSLTGLGTGLRGNVVVADRAVATGTYYGVMAEIFPLGNTAALPAGSNAALGINANAGTAMDLVANAISFSGTDGSGKMIYTNADSDAAAGSIRILVNGAIKYLRFYAAQA